MSGLCFVLMPFDSSFTEIYKEIQDTVNGTGLKCIRADDIYSNGTVINDIVNLIKSATIIIADFTGKNPNVLYETGLAHALKKEVIIITQEINDIPFDLQHIRVISYDESSLGSLSTNLHRTIINVLSSSTTRLPTIRMERIIAYFPLRDNFVNMANNCEAVILSQYSPPGYNTHGIIFDRNLSAIGQLHGIPDGSDNRTVACWFRFSPEFDIKNAKAHFLISFGSAQSEGGAFGIYYGSPQINKFRNEPSAIRLFLYSKGGETDPILFNQKIETGNWYFIACSYSNKDRKLYGYLGDFTSIKDRKFIGQTELDININTYQSTLIYISQIPTEYPSQTLADGGTYFLFPVSKWNFQGYIREILLYDHVLSYEEVMQLAILTKDRI